MSTVFWGGGTLLIYTTTSGDMSLFQDEYERYFVKWVYFRGYAHMLAHVSTRY